VASELSGDTSAPDPAPEPPELPTPEPPELPTPEPPELPLVPSEDDAAVLLDLPFLDDRWVPPSVLPELESESFLDDDDLLFRSVSSLSEVDGMCVERDPVVDEEELSKKCDCASNRACHASIICLFC